MTQPSDARPTVAEPFGFWGPPVPAASNVRERESPAPTKARAAWGLGDVGWAALWFVAAQLALVAVFTVVGMYQVARARHGFTGSADDVAALMDKLRELPTSGGGMLVGLLFEWAVFAGVPLWVSRRKGSGSLSRDFGVRVQWRRDPVTGVLVAVGLNVVFMALSWLLTRCGVNLSGSDNTGLVTDHGGGVWLWLLLAAASIGAPLVEELFFRGLFLRALLKRFTAPLGDAQSSMQAAWRTFCGPGSRFLRRYPVAFSAVTSGTVFGVLHWQGYSHGHLAGALFLIFQTVSLGITFGFIAARANRLGPTMCAHVANNTAASLLAILAMH